MKKISLIFLFIFIGISVNAQIDIRTKGYYKVLVDSVVVSQHKELKEVVQEIINQRFNNPLADVKGSFPEELLVDTQGRLQIQLQEIDTIVLSRMSREIGGWLDYTNAGSEPSPLRAYLPFVGLGLIEIQTETIYNWQKEYRFEQTKTFGKTIYKELDIPFQFVSDTITRIPSETTYRWQTFATEKHCVKTYVNNVYTGDEDISCDPGAIDYYGVNLRRHTNSVSGLQPKTTYLIRVEGTTDAGAFNYMEFEITTL